MSVELGEMHNAVITEDRKLFTFGLNLHGSLGLGIPEDSSCGPLEVQFTRDGREIADYYCLDAAAGGNHTGALIVDFSEK